MTKQVVTTTSLVSNSRDEMIRFLTGIVEDLEEKRRKGMSHDIMDLSRIIVHVQQVEKSRKRKHSREGKRTRQTKENFSRKISTDNRDKRRFNKGLSHKGEPISSKVRYDRNSESKFRRNNEIHKP